MRHEDLQRYHCRKCGTTYHYTIPRPWLLRNLFWFIPIRKFFCARCVKARYAFLKK